MRNRVLWIGLGLVLLLVVVTIVVLPRYLAGCRSVPGVPSFAGASSDPAGADGIGDVYFPRSGNGGSHNGMGLASSQLLTDQTATSHARLTRLGGR